MINMLRVPYIPQCCCWVFAAGDPIPAIAVLDILQFQNVNKYFISSLPHFDHFYWFWLLVINASLMLSLCLHHRLLLLLNFKILFLCNFRAEKNTSNIHVYDCKGSGETLHTYDSLHSNPVVLMKVNSWFMMLNSFFCDLLMECHLEELDAQFFLHDSLCNLLLGLICRIYNWNAKDDGLKIVLSKWFICQLNYEFWATKKDFLHVLNYWNAHQDRTFTLIR